MTNNRTVTLVLVTADNCIGVESFHLNVRGGLVSRGMSWTGEPEMQTVEAIVTDPDGEILSMTGDQWRELEDHGRARELIHAAFHGRLTARTMRRFLNPRRVA